MEKIDLSKFEKGTTQNVQWGEMDALGHVNNVQFIRYFETARVNYMERNNVFDDLLGKEINIVLAHIECKFVQPLYYPDQIELLCRFKTIGNTSMVVEHAVVSKKSGLVAFGDGVIVCTDAKTNQKTPIPERVKKLLENSIK
jgi:acyl-CoA thioester hydrolase